MELATSDRGLDFDTISPSSSSSTSSGLSATTSGAAPSVAGERERLAGRIERDIRAGTDQRIRNLRVQVRGNEVLLDGNCATFYCKQLAQHAAIPGAAGRSVSNHIEVGHLEVG